MTPQPTRRHDIDALRAIAFSLLILYHIGMLYVAEWGWHLKSPHTSEFLQLPMLFVNRWRMDLIFLVSGLATAFLFADRSAGGFLKLRVPKLFIPLLFGVLFIVPIQPYCQGVANGLVEPGFGQFLVRYFSGYNWPKDAFDVWKTSFTWNHLWYLVYLLVYTLLLAALKPVLDSRVGRAVHGRFESLRGWRLLVYPAVFFFGLTLSLQVFFPQTHNLVKDWYFHLRYFSMFLIGFWLARSDVLWAELLRLRKVALAAALIVFAVYYALIKLAPNPAPYEWLPPIWGLRNLYMWLALAAILGWAHALLNRPFRWLPFANEAVYPWYILHQSVIVLLAYWLLPLKLGAVIEPILVITGTIAVCWVLHVGVIRRVGWLRVCFGMKPTKSGQGSEPNVVHQAG
jgi:glucans biosynthesis protein C